MRHAEWSITTHPRRCAPCTGSARAGAGVKHVAHIIDKGMPAEGLLAHTLVSRFVDHLPCYRQEQINGRSGVHTPRSTLAAWSGRAGAGLVALYEAHRAFVPGAATLHADETSVNMLGPRLRQDQTGLCLGLCPFKFRCVARRGIRLLRWAGSKVPH